ncbi:MAG: zinc ribbon domain-containing protein [Bryobacteraceae bacterium]|jgi:putative FmdB family regulatory protein
MPLYEYNCKGCGKKFEVRQKFADKLLTVHESCGGEVERLISAPTLHFKGTGFYVTDYGKNGHLPSNSNSNGHSEPKNGSKADSKSETKTESKSESKSEAKTETRSESKPAPANP